MRPVAQTPTEATDYAVLTTVYGALLGAVAATSRRCEPVPRAEVPVLAAVPSPVRRLLDLTRTSELFEDAPDAATAFKRLDA